MELFDKPTPEATDENRSLFSSADKAPDQDNGIDTFNKVVTRLTDLYAKMSEDPNPENVREYATALRTVMMSQEATMTLLSAGIGAIYLLEKERNDNDHD